MTRDISLILFAVLMNAVGMIMLKKGMNGVGPISFDKASLHGAIVDTVLNPFVFAGLSVYLVSVVFFLVILSRVELSFAYPFLSLAYVIVAASAYFLFQEDLNVFRIAGIGFICLGTALIAQS